MVVSGLNEPTTIQTKTNKRENFYHVVVSNVINKLLKIISILRRIILYKSNKIWLFHDVGALKLQNFVKGSLKLIDQLFTPKDNPKQNKKS